MSFKRYTPPPYDEFQPAEEMTDTSGGGWSTVVAPVGNPVACKMRDLTSREKYTSMGDFTKRLKSVWCDLPLPESVSEENPILYPVGSDAEWNVTAVVEYPERGVAQIDIQKTTN